MLCPILERVFVGDAEGYREWQVMNRLHVGSWNRNPCATVHAARDPWHRELVGYTGRCSPTHPEYLWAQREMRLALNLVDASEARYFQPAIFQTALSFIDERLAEGYRILVHCNRGESRAPSLILLYHSTRFVHFPSFRDAARWLTLQYPQYQPGRGIQDHLETYWHTYHHGV